MTHITTETVQLLSFVAITCTKNTITPWTDAIMNESNTIRPYIGTIIKWQQF
jgi:hypothetical protein